MIWPPTGDCQDDLSVPVQDPSDLVCQLKRYGLVSVEVSNTVIHEPRGRGFSQIDRGDWGVKCQKKVEE